MPDHEAQAEPSRLPRGPCSLRRVAAIVEDGEPEAPAQHAAGCVQRATARVAPWRICSPKAWYGHRPGDADRDRADPALLGRMRLASRHEGDRQDRADPGHRAD